MATFKSISAYFVYLRQLIYANGCLKNPEAIQLAKGRNSREGRVFAEELSLKLGGTIQFHEHIVLSDIGEVSRPIYSYGFKHDNVTFRYDRDPARRQPIVHEECHLHVHGLYAISGDELRFKTHETNFEEVFIFIARCFST